MARTPASEAFSNTCKVYGLRRKGSTLYVDLAETIGVLKLRRSTWGGRSFVDVAVWLRALGEDEAPDEIECHVRSDLGLLFPGEEARIAASLLDEHESDYDAARVDLEGYLGRAVQMLTSMDTVEAIACSVEGQRFLLHALRTSHADELLKQCADR